MNIDNINRIRISTDCWEEFLLSYWFAQLNWNVKRANFIYERAIHSGGLCYSQNEYMGIVINHSITHVYSIF